MDIQESYAKKGNEYFSYLRYDIISLIPPGTKRILDVGCGNGDNGLIIKELLGVEEIIGIELFKPAAVIAKSKLENVIVGDIEYLELDFPEGYFDCIICADLLEHTRDPWKILRKLQCFLQAKGVLITSIPNIRHIVPILKIVFDRFKYEESGILDKTHLRFFTLYTIKEMLKKTGYQIEQISTNHSNSWKFKLLNFCSMGIMRRFSITQYLIVAKSRNLKTGSK